MKENEGENSKSRQAAVLHNSWPQLRLVMLGVATALPLNADCWTMRSYPQVWAGGREVDAASEPRNCQCCHGHRREQLRGTRRV
jgi:hypothetical protein